LLRITHLPLKGKASIGFVSFLKRITKPPQGIPAGENSELFIYV